MDETVFAHKMMDVGVLRVVAERSELTLKLEALEKFIGSETFTRIPQPDQELLEKQRHAMNAYENILGERVRLYRERADDIDWKRLCVETLDISTLPESLQGPAGKLIELWKEELAGSENAKDS